MADFRSKPTLIPREYKDGSGWYVEATWDDRPPEQIGGFQSDSEGSRLDQSEIDRLLHLILSNPIHDCGDMMLHVPDFV